MAKRHPDVLFVCAAGNLRRDLDGESDSWGFDSPNLITVGAVDLQGNKSSFSNYATGDGVVNIAAPGEIIFMGTDTNGNPICDFGICYATPMVAAAALIRSIAPDPSAAEVKEIILAAATDQVTVDDKTTSIDPRLGGCIPRMDSAVQRAVNKVREKQGLEPIDRDTLLALGRLDSGASARVKLSPSLVSTYLGTVELSTEVPDCGTVKGSAALTIIVDEDGTTTFSFWGEKSLTVTDGGETATETIKLNGELTGTTDSTGLQARGTVDSEVTIGWVTEWTFDLSNESTATGSIAGGTRIDGTLEVVRVTGPYTTTWSATRQ